jgi:hypothetical protein
MGRGSSRVSSNDPINLAKRAVYAAIALFIHTGLIAVSIIAVYAIETLIHVLWPGASPLLFDRVPLSWLSQAIDCVFFVLFGTMGVRDAFQILRGEK